MKYEAIEPTARLSQERSATSALSPELWDKGSGGGSRASGGAVVHAADGSASSALIAKGTDGFAIVDTMHGAEATAQLATNSAHELANKVTMRSELSSTHKAEIAPAVAAGVSSAFVKRVNDFVHSIPVHLQSTMREQHIGVSVFSNSSQLPGSIRAMQARRHSGESYSNLPMFYNPATKSIVVVEKPDLTASEASSKQAVDETQEHNAAKGVQTFGKEYDPKVARYQGIERNGWHELGHALDFTALHNMSKSKSFDAAFRSGLKRVAALDSYQQKEIEYFFRADGTGAKGHEYDAPKQELLAELFAAYRAPASTQSKRDRMLVTAFPEVVNLMSKDPHHLLRS